MERISPIKALDFIRENAIKFAQARADVIYLQEYRKSLNVFREKLNEVAIFNSNLAYATRLFTEHSTTKDEKVDIIKRFDEAKYIMEIFFETPQVDRALLYQKDNEATVQNWLSRVIEDISKLEFSHDAVENCLRSLCDKLAVSPGRLFSVLRVGLTGRNQAPGLFDIFVTLGREETLKRLKALTK